LSSDDGDFELGCPAVRTALLLLVAAACAPEEEQPLPLSPCRLSDTPTIEVAHAEWGFGQIPASADIELRTAPQGGGLFSAFMLRLTGLEIASELGVALRATRLSDSQLVGEQANRPRRFICSNTGENYGTIVGSDVHVFYNGFLPEDIDGSPVRFDFEVTDRDGRSVQTSFEGTLRYVF
jgi:hypothetical protein